MPVAQEMKREDTRAVGWPGVGIDQMRGLGKRGAGNDTELSDFFMRLGHACVSQDCYLLGGPGPTSLCVPSRAGLQASVQDGDRKLQACPSLLSSFSSHNLSSV